MDNEKPHTVPDLAKKRNEDHHMDAFEQAHYLATGEKIKHPWREKKDRA